MECNKIILNPKEKLKMKKKATNKSPPMALVKIEDLNKLLNGTWQVSNDLDELSYRFDEVSQLLDSVNIDFDDGKAACFFYLSERLYNENKKQLEDILHRLGQLLWEARGMRR
jgi:hypothetical protein